MSYNQNDPDPGREKALAVGVVVKGSARRPPETVKARVAVKVLKVVGATAHRLRPETAKVRVVAAEKVLKVVGATAHRRPPETAKVRVVAAEKVLKVVGATAHRRPETATVRLLPRGKDDRVVEESPSAVRNATAPRPELEQSKQQLSKSTNC